MVDLFPLTNMETIKLELLLNWAGEGAPMDSVVEVGLRAVVEVNKVLDEVEAVKVAEEVEEGGGIDEEGVVGVIGDEMDLALPLGPLLEVSNPQHPNRLS